MSTLTRKDRPAWTSAKSIGTAGEMRVERFWLEHGLLVTRSRDDVAAAHDLRITGTVEVKTDAKAQTSGNIAVEIRHNHRLSGIITSRADAWCVVVGSIGYMLPTEKLRTLVETRYFPRVQAGENAECLLVPLDTIRAISRVIPLGGEG